MIMIAPAGQAARATGGTRGRLPDPVVTRAAGRRAGGGPGLGVTWHLRLTDPAERPGRLLAGQPYVRR